MTMADHLDDLITQLLAQPSAGERLALLRAEGLLDEAGLSRLMDEAEAVMYREPALAGEVAAACADAAGPAGTALRPRADYLRAQSLAIDGQLEEALRLVDAARDAWLDEGAELPALRTSIGRMHVLQDAGRHVEAVRIGEALLAGLDRLDDGSTSLQQRRALRAQAHNYLGASHGFMGDYERALAAYEAAERHYTAAGLADRIPPLWHDRGVELLNLGRATSALGAFQEAADRFRDLGQQHRQAQSLIDVGRARLLLGQYTASLDAYERARALLDRNGVRLDRDLLLIATAEAYLALNLFEDAIATYRQAEQSLRTAGTIQHLASALTGMGTAIAGALRYADADPVLSEAVELWAGVGNAPMVATTLLEQAAVRDRLGDPDGALALARRALDTVADGEWAVEQVYAHLRIADLVLPSIDEVERHLMHAGALAQDLALPPLQYRLDQRRGHLRRLQDRQDEALGLLENAVAGIEALRGPLSQETMRASFLQDKVAAYADLVGLWLDRGDDASLRRAFGVAEQAKSRALVDLLAGLVTARLDDAHGTDADRFNVLRADLAAVYNEMLGSEGGSGDDGARRPTLRGRATELERSISLLQLQIASRTAPPDPRPGACQRAGELLDANVPSLDELPQRLPRDVVTVAYHTLDDEILAFVSDGDRLRVVRRVSMRSRVDPLVKRLHAQWARFNAGSAFVDRHAERLLLSTQRVLRSLHTELVEPLGEALPTAGSPGDDGPPRLAVIPHGVLHHVPFHALYDGHRYLLEGFELSIAPSVTVLSLCQAKPAAAPERALVMGVADTDIPYVASEVEACARALPGACVALGQQATLATLNKHVASADIVHLACHGLFRPDNPMFSALRLHDCWLTAADALQLNVGGALVTLSACESGLSHVAEGDEPIGLARGFLGAGAAAVLVSLWIVQDRTTADLMARWYELMGEGRRRAEALRLAQLETASRQPHPYHWAPFVLVGAP